VPAAGVATYPKPHSMAPDPTETKPCYMAALPNELLLIISKGSALKDQLSFADTCTACRPLISEAECIEVCTRAGLIQVEGVSARAMAKLLFQPRVGVCNWSLEGGIPKSV